MNKTTFWDVIENTLEKAGAPLSAKEIWDQARELDTLGDLKTTGKTPWQTIGAYCYTDITKNGESSKIVQTNDRPAQFFLRRLAEKSDNQKLQRQRESYVASREKSEPARFTERDLHPLLVAYAKADGHFQANLKTIFHEASNRNGKGQNEWLHPDLVGVYFPFSHLKKETIELQSRLSVSSIMLFSFELKVSLSYANLRQSYFQAVSNSSWANEGYLATLNFQNDSKFKDEVRRLNNAFGIGIIKLNAESIFESEILFPARFRQEIDWDTVDRLAADNVDFSDFLKSVTEDCSLGKIKSQYDEEMSAEDLNLYIKNKWIRDTSI